MRFSPTVDVSDVEEAARLIREALKGSFHASHKCCSEMLTQSSALIESATDPLTGLIDVDMLNTGQGAQGRKIRGDFRREVLAILDSQSSAMRYNDLLKALDNQASVAVEPTDFSEVIRELEQEGEIKCTGERERRMIRRMTSA